jgi:histidinol-phosphatase
MYKGELIVGVSNAPGFKEMAYAEKGQGAWLNGEKIEVSDIADISKATLSLGNIATIAGKPQWQTVGELIQEVHRIRGYGDFYHYHLLASGKIDMIIESDVNILDIAALSVIINEAGGCFTDLSGQALTLDTTSVLACNLQSTHQNLLDRLQYV